MKNMLTIAIDAIRIFLVAFVFLGVSFYSFAQDSHSESDVIQSLNDNSAHVKLVFEAENFNPGYWCPSFLEKFIFEVFDSEGNPIPKVPCDTMIICPLCVCIDTTGHSLPYTVTYFYDDRHAPMSGVNTLQLVMTMRHMLKINEFTDFCNHLRMDYNEDGSLSVSDLIGFRDYIITGEPGPFNMVQLYDPDWSRQKAFFPLQIDELIDTVYTFNLLNKGNVTGINDFYCQSDFTGDFEYAADYLISDPVQINAEWKRNEDSDLIELRFSKKDSRKINAFQISFVYDTTIIEIDTVKWVESPHRINNFHRIDDEFFSIEFFNDTSSHEELFTVVFTEKKKLNKDLFEYLDFENTRLRQEVTTEGFYSTPVVFEFSGPLKTLNPGEFADIYVSPNPFSNDVTIYTNQGFKSDISVRIYDMFGKMTGFMNANAGTEEIRVPEYFFPTNGVYLLSLEDGKSKTTIKLVKTR